MKYTLTLLLLTSCFSALAQTEFHFGTGIGFYGEDGEGFPVTFSIEPQLFIQDQSTVGITGAYSIDDDYQASLFYHYGRTNLVYFGLGLGIQNVDGFNSQFYSVSDGNAIVIQPRIGFNLGAGFDFRVYGGFSSDAAARGGVSLNKVF